MKTSSIALVGIAIFGGVLGALQVDRHLSNRTDSSAPLFESQASQPLRQVALQPVESPVDFRAASRKVTPSVVSVDRYNRARRSFMDERVVEAETGTGSGVVLSENGIIVTNNHVVQQADRVRVRLSDGRGVDAKVLGTDPRSDLAVLKIEAKNLTPIELGTSKDVEVGQWVLAIGNPMGFDNTVSVGVVSSLKRNLPVGQSGLVGAIQTDAAINPGNSGGALTNAQGQLIGINSAIASQTGGSVGIGFAIPVDRVKAVVNDIVKLGYARYAGLGIRYNGNLDGALGNPAAREQIAAELGVTNLPTSGVIVLESGGSAQSAGIAQGDVILSIDGEKIDGTFDLNRALMPKKPGEKATVKFWSKGQVKTAQVTLQEIRPTI
jgi:S1-C subfamily serine protease